MSAAVAAAGATLPEGLAPPPLRSDAGLQQMSAFWRVSFHVLFHCDLRLSDPDADFQPPAPFTIDDEDTGARVLARDDLVRYAEHCRAKAVDTIIHLTPALDRKRIGHWGVDFGRGLRITLAHLDEHGGQIEGAVSEWSQGVRPPSRT